MYTTINNQKIYFQKVGEGKDLILLHGWGVDVSSFWPSVEVLKDHFTLWLIDLPGMGRSDPPKKDWAILDYAKLVEEFILEQKIKKPILLGHSFGGRITIKLAAKSPHILGKIILEDSAGLSRNKGIKNSLLKIITKITKYLIPNIFNIRELIRIKIYQALKSDYQHGALRETFLKTIQEDLSNDCKKIALDTLIIWGEKDQSTPLKDGKRMYQLIKNSKLAILEGVGHTPHIKDPERFSYYVKDFA